MRRHLLTAATLASLLSSCSVVADPGRHTSGQGVASTAFCDDYANLICDANRDCCSTEIDGCLVAVRSLCGVVEPALGTPITGYNPRRAGLYLAEVRSLTQMCDVGAVQVLDLRNAIDSVLDGTRARGEECSTDGGAPDIAGFTSCQRGLACTLDLDGRWICSSPAEEGEACPSPVSCAAGLTCLGLAGSPLGTCGPPIPDGMPCGADSDCASLRCSPSNDNTCQPQTVESTFCGGDP